MNSLPHGGRRCCCRSELAREWSRTCASPAEPAPTKARGLRSPDKRQRNPGCLVSPLGAWPCAGLPAAATRSVTGGIPTRSVGTIGIFVPHGGQRCCCRSELAREWGTHRLRQQSRLRQKHAASVARISASVIRVASCHLWVLGLALVCLPLRRGASREAFPRGAWERSVFSSHMAANAAVVGASLLANGARIGFDSRAGSDKSTRPP